MNIYFQSGEFLASDGSSLLDLFVQFLGIVVGAGISILVFQLGKRHEKEEAKNRLLDLEEYVKVSLSNLLDPFDKQLKALSDFSELLTSVRDIHYTPQTIVSFHAKSIRWISHEDLHKIFVSNKGKNPANSEMLRRLNSSLDYIDSFGKYLEESLIFFMSKKQEYVGEFNDKFKRISLLKDDLYVKYNDFVKQQPDFKYVFFHDLDSLFSEWSKMDDFREWDIARKYFIEPLISLCRNSEFDKNVLEILGLANDCIYALDNLSSTQEFIKDSIDFKIRQLEKTRVNLTEFQSHFWKDT